MDSRLFLTLIRLREASVKLASFMKRELLLKPPESWSVDTEGFHTWGMADAAASAAAAAVRGGVVAGAVTVRMQS